MPSTLAAVMPPITVVPMIWRATEPAPEAVQRGTQPRMNANEVIMMGRKRRRAPSSAASISGLPCSYCSLANSTMRIAFLAAQPQHTESAKDCNRGTQQHAERQTPAFVERREDEEDEEQRESEDDRRRY